MGHEEDLLVDIAVAVQLPQWILLPPKVIKRRGTIMKESFELNAVKDEMMNMLTYDCRGAAICMLADILLLANRDNAVSVCDIFGLNHKSIDRSWDQYGWTIEDIIDIGTPFVSKNVDGKYRVCLPFHLMKRLDRDVQYYDEMHNCPSLNDLLNDSGKEPIAKKEVLNEKPKEPKKPHEYSLSFDSSYRIGYKEDGTLCKTIIRPIVSM